MRLISKQVFRQYMEHRGMSNADLAKAADCSKSSIAFLRSNGKSARDTVGRKAASRIEAALNAPPGSLFSATVIVASGSNKPYAA